MNITEYRASAIFHYAIQDAVFRAEDTYQAMVHDLRVPCDYKFRLAITLCENALISLETAKIIIKFRENRIL